MSVDDLLVWQVSPHVFVEYPVQLNCRSVLCRSCMLLTLLLYSWIFPDSLQWVWKEAASCMDCWLSVKQVSYRKTSCPLIFYWLLDSFYSNSWKGKMVQVPHILLLSDCVCRACASSSRYLTFGLCKQWCGIWCQRWFTLQRLEFIQRSTKFGEFSFPLI